MTSDVSAANIEINEQADLIAQILTALEGKTGAGDESKILLKKITSNQYSGFEVVIPEETPNIRPYAFYKHGGIASVIIPDSVIDIAYAAFSGCTGLTSVTVGAGLKSMNGEVFNGCSSCLTYDFSKCEQIPTMSMPCFGGINANAKILVPSNLYSDWVSADNWGTYYSYIYPVDNKSIYLTISNPIGESQFSLYDLDIDTNYHYYSNPLVEAKAYYSYDGGETIYEELTSTSSINGGDLKFDSAEDHPGTYYWNFSGSYIYFWGNTVDIWVELNGVKVFSRHIESTLV